MAGRRPQFALDLSDEKVVLWHRKGSQGWAPLGEVSLSDPEFGRALAALRDRAPLRGRGAVVRLPRSQVLLTRIRLGVFEGDAAVSHARKQIDELTPYSLDEIAWDLGEKGFGNMAPVAVVARKTLREADEFVRGHGFEPLYYTVKHEEREFPREPRFWLEEESPAARRVGLLVPLVTAAAVGLTAGFLAYSWLSGPGSAVTTALPPAETGAQAAATGTTQAAPEAEDAAAAGSERVAALAPEAGAGLADALPDIAPDLPPPTVALEPLREGPYPEILSADLRRTEKAPPPRQIRLAGLQEAAPTVSTEPSREKTVALRVAEARRELPDVDLEAILAPLAGLEPFAPEPASEGEAPRPGIEVARLSDPGQSATDALEVPQLPQVGESKAELTERVTADPPPLPRPKSLVTAEPGTLTPTPEGTLGPDNILIFSGRPPQVPPARPGSERVVAPDPLAQFRPRLRPEGLKVPPGALSAGAEAEVSPFADPALAGIRPRLRPERFAGLLPEPAPGQAPAAGLEPPPAEEAAPEAAPAPSRAAAPPPVPVLAALPESGADPLAPQAEGAPDQAETPQGADLLALADPALRRFRAPPRPEGLAPAPPETPSADTAALVADPALKRFRPRPRPDSLKIPPGALGVAAQGQDAPDGTPPAPAEPPAGPPAELPSETAEAADPGADLLAQADPALAGKRPRLRPADLAPAAAAEPGDAALVTDPALAGKRPRLRPDEIAILADLQQEEDEADAGSGLETASALAVATSPQPRVRPARIAAVAQKVMDQVQKEAADTRATASTPESARGTARLPAAPTTASVARAASEKASFSKSRMSLVGVFGTPSARRALVRLPTGRYVKVKRGDRISGWQVSAIGEDSLRISKGSRNQTLRVP